jgi:hypothetical protein
MAIPSVVNMAAQPGGGLVSSLNALNALNDALQQTKYNAVKAQYAPLTLSAEAASRMAYANLLGPQFVAKLMGNSDVVANSPQLQNPATLQKLYQAGMGGGTGNALLNMPAPQAQQSGLGNFVNTVKNAFGLGDKTPAPQSSQNAVLQSPTMASGGDNEPYPSASSQPTPGQTWRKEQERQGQGDSSGYAYNPDGTNVVASPQEIAAAANGNGGKGTYAENAGNFAGTKAELEETGKLRAKDIQDLSDVVFTGSTKQATLDGISNIISSPAFEEIRKTPILGDKELTYFQRYGTPEQQNMVGQLMTLSGNVIKDASRDFAGQFRKGEQQLLENMKVNPGDTFNAARGKMEQLSYLNKLITERSRLTAQIMQQNHISKLQAEPFADKQINGDKIRSAIHNQLNPQPTEEDINHMAEKYKISTDEVKNRLRKKGYTLSIKLDGEK